MKQWYETLYENNAKKYDSERFVQGTVGEVDFIERELSFDKTKTILDVGCGTGRHSIELAKRGYKVTGIDLSKAQIERARQKAKEANVQIDFIQKDARKLQFKECFDAAILICEGSFALMETDEMNFKILQNVSKALKEDGKFILTTLNALFPLTHDKTIEDPNFKQIDFNITTLRETVILKFKDDSEKENQITCNIRYYCPSEITWYLKSLKFKDIGMFGCKLGAFNRKDKLSKDDYEILVVAQK
ncbi:MAG: class I SAM-dependent methyltransferase [Planctomycetaceae bacterium]|nr:class I SAM-dependent methyltransferase [Planctomycetaceae bacterium]